jgi:hypothetical protein
MSCISSPGDTHCNEGRGPRVFDYVLATLIWHEMPHIAGADEREAQSQEEELWQRFVTGRRVEGSLGLRYLALLRNRH